MKRSYSWVKDLFTTREWGEGLEAVSPPAQGIREQATLLLGKKWDLSKYDPVYDLAQSFEDVFTASDIMIRFCCDDTGMAFRLSSVRSYTNQGILSFGF